MTPAPIILVPGFWLGAWAWDEVAAALRAAGHDVTAITLPGLESVATDRASITFADHVEAIVRRGEGREHARRAGGPQRERLLGLRRERPRAGAHRRDGLRRHRPRRATARPDVRGSREADGLERDRGRGELSMDSPRSRSRRSAMRAVPVPGGVLRGTGSRSPTRRGPRHPQHDHLHRLPRRGVPALREGERLVVARGYQGATGYHLGRSADQPLADVVTADRARGIIGEVATAHGTPAGE